MSKVLSVIPAAGSATRMMGIPKFLVPNASGMSLLRWHVSKSNFFADHTIVVTRPEWSYLAFEALLGLNFELQVVRTKTMTETVALALGSRNPKVALVQMPDTYLGNDSTLELTVNLSLEKASSAVSLWRTRPEQQGKLGQVEVKADNSGQYYVTKIVDKDPEFSSQFHWGAIAFFEPDCDEWNLSDAHVGITLQKMISSRDTFRVPAVISEELYYDCGTPKEYSSFLSRVIEH